MPTRTNRWLCTACTILTATAALVAQQLQYPETR